MPADRQESQRDKFKAAAKELETNDDPERFKEKLEKQKPADEKSDGHGG